MSNTEYVRKALAGGFTLVAVKLMLEALHTLQARLDAGEATLSSHGVCAALDRILAYPDPYRFVRIAVEDWPEAIRDGDGTAASYPVSATGGFWVGENRAARIRLIAHLTQHCEALLAKGAAALARDLEGASNN